nr:hypothetical protein [Tanacetum cinerariifolium]
MPKKIHTTDQYIFQRWILVNEEASTRPSTQPEDDTSANIVRDTPSPTDAETCAKTDKTNSEGDTKILNISEEQGEDVATKVDLEEKTAEFDKGQAGSDPDPEPMHDDFVASMFFQVNDSLKQPDLLSSTRTLSSMKNLDAYTFSDQFFNDKPTNKDPRKINMETKVESMVTILIHQVSSSAPLLSTPVIDLTPPEPGENTILNKDPGLCLTWQKMITVLEILSSSPKAHGQAPVGGVAFCEPASSLTQKLPIVEERALVEEDQARPDPGQSHVALVGPDPEPMHDDFVANMFFQVNDSLKQPDPLSSTRTLSSMKNLDAYTFGDQFFNDKPTNKDPRKTNMETEVESMVTILIHQVSSSAPLLSTPVIDLTPPEPSMKLSKRLSKSQPKHVSLYEALEASMDRDNRDEFIEASAKSCKRHHDDQDPPPPLPDSDQGKKKRHDSNASISHQPQAQMPSALKTTNTRDMEECHLLLTGQIDLVNPKGHRFVPNVSKPLPLGGSKERSALSISMLKAANYPDFGLEELVPSLYSAPSDRHAIRSHRRILNVVSLKKISRYGYTYLKENVLCRAGLKEYNISEFDLKNLHPNDFEDLYLLHLQGKLNHLSRSDKVNMFNAVNMWIRNIVIKKRVED